jgi:Methylcrotonoyl-CoA carboxylase subunit alpha BT domain
MHHSAKTTVEFEWDNDLDGSFGGRLKLAITHQTDGGYFIKVNTLNKMSYKSRT